MATTPFKVIQGHHFLCQESCIRLATSMPE